MPYITKKLLGPALEAATDRLLSKRELLQETSDSSMGAPMQAAMHEQ
jgi:hypothetical protein